MAQLGGGYSVARFFARKKERTGKSHKGPHIGAAIGGSTRGRPGYVGLSGRGFYRGFTRVGPDGSSCGRLKNPETAFPGPPPSPVMRAWPCVSPPITKSI